MCFGKLHHFCPIFLFFRAHVKKKDSSVLFRSKSLQNRSGYFGFFSVPRKINRLLCYETSASVYQRYPFSYMSTQSKVERNPTTFFSPFAYRQCVIRFDFNRLTATMCVYVLNVFSTNFGTPSDFGGICYKQ